MVRGDKTLGTMSVNTLGHTIQEGVQRESRRGTLGVKTLQKADTPSKKGYNERQSETRPSGRRTHHPTKGNKTKGDKTLGKADTPSDKGKQEGAQWKKEDETFGKADAPSNKRKPEGAQWKTKENKTLRKADTPSNKGKHEWVQWETRPPQEGGHSIQQQHVLRRTP